MLCHIPFVKERFYQFNEKLGFFWFDIDNNVDVLFHMRANIANLSNVIDCIYAFWRYAFWCISRINSFSKLRNFIDQPALFYFTEVTYHSL